MVKKFIVLMTVVSLVLGAVPMAAAAEPIQMMLNGEPIRTDAAPILEQGRVYVPIRAVAEALGASVSWEAKTETAKVHKWSTHVSLTVGEKTAWVERVGNALYSGERETNTVDATIKLAHNRLYIPLRAISEVFGYSVKWENHTVFIESPVAQWESWVEGDLEESRQFATTIPHSRELQFAYEPLAVTQMSEDFNRTYVFPEGEALRFFYLFRNTASFIQLKDGFPVVVWQAHIPEGGGLHSFLNGDFTEEQGAAPVIDKPYLYYSTSMFGDSYSVSSGIVTTEGTTTRLGYKGEAAGTVISEEGTIMLKLPNETRAEVAGE